MKRLLIACLFTIAALSLAGCPPPTPQGDNLLSEWKLQFFGTQISVWFYRDGTTEVENFASNTPMTGEWFDRGNGRINFTYWINTANVRLEGGTTLDTATDWSGAVTNALGTNVQVTGFRVYPAQKDDDIGTGTMERLFSPESIQRALLNSLY